AGALDRLTNELPDLLVLDYTLPDGTALDVLRHLKMNGIELPVIVLTGNGSIELAVTAVKEGAEQFLTKPIELASLAVVVDRAIEHHHNRRRLQAAQSRSAAGNAGDDLFGGRSPAVHALGRDARAAADCDAPILIEGETGTGKGMLARWIHNASGRSS